MNAIELTDQQADDWLARLEDPATKRGTGRLRDKGDPEVMCCLGHLADILDPGGWEMVRGLLEWGGSDVHLPDVTYRGMELGQYDMASINDVEDRFPIDEIREWIEEARAQP